MISISTFTSSSEVCTENKLEASIYMYVCMCVCMVETNSDDVMKRNTH